MAATTKSELPEGRSKRVGSTADSQTVLKISPTRSPFTFRVRLPACDVDEAPIDLIRVLKAESRKKRVGYCSDRCCNRNMKRLQRSGSTQPKTKPRAKKKVSR